jgi:hypothetical protein
MKVLVACEFSGVVREAFRKRGHDAWSCDLRHSEGNHIQDDVLKHLEGWDLMIGHPPCTYLSYVGIAHWNKPGRCLKRLEALNFFRQLWESPIEKICLENPKGCASPTIAKYTQEIQPYYFGDREIKTTWLWLKNLPMLQHFSEDTLFDSSTHTEKPEPISIDNTPRQKKRYFTDAKTRDPYLRAVTFQGIANAMAEQWG